MEGLAGDNITDESEHTCGGFCNLLEMLKRCFASASAHLWVETTTTKVYFCKATHLVWFLIKKNCKQGVKPKAKAKPKPQSKKRKELPEGTTDAPMSGKEEASDDGNVDAI
ncbi:uncharacterized protein ACA1_036540 [Acanthamoeba castellanii str. Neff]|uniref:Uncharacterized protein n=1 Tax=Acanthamoeba castellanii (strain ATCC 30010 / Neff) TaxID=1257118 RepID=L8HEX9_ACACF|nr:uncharacterized protein ACA1_036540 [Acanthamoeba castellanii str. Neff]ELR22961.1 hypothetical protein ACA1_036540 [Acanthamoeba castellanii str. Neff]